MDQCPGWIGVAANLFPAPGVRVARLGGGSAETLKGLLAGDWEFAHLGLEAVVRGVLEGADPVLVLSPVDAHRAGSLMGKAGIRSPEQLAGTRVGVATEGGVSGVSARAILQRWGVSATLVALGSSDAVYAALQSEKIDAGYLPVELGFRGRAEFGWNVFEGGTPGVSGGIVTTRRFVASHRDTVAGVVKGLVDAIRFVKARPAETRGLLGRYLEFSDAKAIAELHEYYAPIYRAVPAPTAFFAAQGLRDAFASRYPGARTIETADYIDASFVDELNRSGYIERLYAAWQLARAPPS